MAKHTEDWDRRIRAARKLLSAMVFLAILLIIGTLGYHLIDPDVDFFSALYMTVITITTVGFGEISGLGPGSRWLTMFLIFSGFGLISYVLVALSQMVVEGEIQKLIGRRRMSQTIKSMRNHVIVCGFGSIGEVICSFMRQYNRPFVVVEIDGERGAELEEKGIPYIIGDATQDEVLLEARIADSVALFAATPSDSQNVFIVLTARELNPKLLIHSRGYAEEAEKRLLRAGADKVIFPDKIGGARMAMGLIRPTFTNFVDVVSHSYEGEQIAVDELRIAGACRLVGRTLMETQIRQQYNLIIIAIRDRGGQFHFNPGKDTVFQDGDTLIAIGLREDLSAFAREINAEEAPS